MSKLETGSKTEERGAERKAIFPVGTVPTVPERSFLPEPDFAQSRPPATQVNIGTVERDLVNALSRAMTQGLVAASDFRPAGEIVATDDPDQPEKAPDKPAPAQVQTQIESDRARTTILAIEGDAPQCVKSVKRYQLPQEVSFDQLAGLRGKLFNDLDRVVVQSALELAAAEIALGFAVEAKSTLSLLPQGIPEVDYLSSIALTVARKPLPDGTFSEAIGCESPELIWALLASSVAPNVTDAGADKAVLQFFNLSAQLRRYIGPPLAEKLLASGRTAQARRVAENAQKLDPAAAMDLARIDMAPEGADALGLDPNTETAAALAEVDRGSTKALQRLLQRAIDQDLDLATEDLLFIDAAIFQFRREPAGQDLARLKLRYALHRRNPSLTREALDVMTANHATLEQALLQESFALLSDEEDEFHSLLLKSYLSNWGGDVLVPNGASMTPVAIGAWLEQNAPAYSSAEAQGAAVNHATQPASNRTPPQTLTERLERLATIVGSDLE
ncbi:hypothetical protein [Tropicimonas sp. S265A]|uniref:hypothetical protein n=1 Tax=Tropicimonas sp. S265A TaxID=3415134 RepID=UPI003C7D692E